MNSTAKSVMTAITTTTMHVATPVQTRTTTLRPRLPETYACVWYVDWRTQLGVSARTAGDAPIQTENPSFWRFIHACGDVRTKVAAQIPSGIDAMDSSADDVLSVGS